MDTRYRKTVIAGNWKMNMLASEVRSFADGLRSVAPPPYNCDIVFCVPFPLIPAALSAFRDGKNSRVFVGAQNISEHVSGAYTGEVSAAMLADLGVTHVIIGHSERRAYFGETDETVNKKVHAALNAGLRPIICVGETIEQRELGITNDLITLQVKTALSGVPAQKMRRVILAYEPVWAIGTGHTATAEQAAEVCAVIRSAIRSLYGARTARSVTIQYGGSMNGGNAPELLSMSDIDGGLIGGASLSYEKFAEVISAATV